MYPPPSIEIGLTDLPKYGGRGRLTLLAPTALSLVQGTYAMYLVAQIRVLTKIIRSGKNLLNIILDMNLNCTEGIISIYFVRIAK